MNILALDMATRTGWALLENGAINHGVQEFAVGRGESPGMRWLKFDRWLSQVTDPLDRMGSVPLDQISREQTNFKAPTIARVGLIIYEAAHHRGGPATQVGYGFTTKVHEFCARHAIEHTSVSTPTLKKFVLGAAPKRKKGDPKFDRSKDAMIRGVNRRWSLALIDDNEADAVAILHYAIETLGHR